MKDRKRIKPTAVGEDFVRKKGIFTDWIMWTLKRGLKSICEDYSGRSQEVKIMGNEDE